ncbi:cytochrome P450 1A1-like [Mercenaria mercenaria]|uniref:cytochrome P450 1A1-like n=1 Tax=Mercenaria mercenaria TaxID=6596 RepID=UPI00234F1B0B|nr:cytochrome P450 1A1-like [Mercenaria mercenaria]
MSDDDPSRDIFWERAYVADFFCNQFNNTIMTLLPFMRFLPTKYREMYQKGQSLNALIAQRYFYDIKKTHVPGEGNSIVHYYLDEQRKEIESNREPFFTDDRIHAMMYETIVAGIATTLSALTSSMLILLNFPEYQTKIQKELDQHVGQGRLPTFSDRANCTFLKAFELEVPRFVPVLPLLLPHLCVEHVEFEGLDIEPNSTVIANLWFVHHDEKLWGDPWTFRPERFLDEHGDLLPFDHVYLKSVMSFGIGQRQCAAELFAKTRYFLYIATLLQRWRFEFPPGKEQTCDPRSAEAFETKATLTAKPFFCCARERNS